MLSSRSEFPYCLFFFQKLMFFNAEKTLKSYICSGSLKVKVESNRVNISLSYENTLFPYVKKWLQKGRTWEASWDVMLHAFLPASYLSVIYWPLCFTLLKLCSLSVLLVITEELTSKWITSFSSRWLMKAVNPLSHWWIVTDASHLVASRVLERTTSSKKLDH